MIFIFAWNISCNHKIPRLEAINSQTYTLKEDSEKYLRNSSLIRISEIDFHQVMTQKGTSTLSECTSFCILLTNNILCSQLAYCMLMTQESVGH